MLRFTLYARLVVSHCEHKCCRSLADGQRCPHSSQQQQRQPDRHGRSGTGLRGLRVFSWDDWGKMLLGQWLLSAISARSSSVTKLWGVGKGAYAEYAVVSR